MSNIPEHIDDLISKYLAGEASTSEVALVRDWARSNHENQKYLSQLELIFQKAASVQTLQDFDADAAWAKMRQKINAKGKTVQLKPQSSFSWLRIAATILLIAGAGFGLFKFISAEQVPPNIALTSSDDQTKSDTLPDGSGVFLNKLTKLDYAFDKKQRTHKVKLSGEAYFHIRHEDDKKFLVEAEGVYIRDIGTSFNVTAYPDRNTIEVVVEEGEVQFFSDVNPGIYLKAGGRGIYDKKAKTFTIEQPEANVLAYKTRFFSFSDANLKEVVTAINDVYDKKIILSQNLEHCHLTVSFNNESVSEIAHVIAETLGLTVTETTDGFLLEGKSCE